MHYDFTFKGKILIKIVLVIKLTWRHFPRICFKLLDFILQFLMDAS